MMKFERVIALFGIIGFLIALFTADAPLGIFDLIGLAAMAGSDYVPGIARYPLKVIGIAVVLIITIMVIIIAVALLLGISLVLGGSI